MDKFKFIDLFSGIGGFHQAMISLGGECVFASEIDPSCIETYRKNYGVDANTNVREVKAEDIPKHDVLCGGFPCQAFSKAGSRLGMLDTRGTLFFEIERILKYHKTKYIILENVRNLVSHDNGNTWKVIQETLTNLGYRLTLKPLLLSPHNFGVPQLRERVVILGVYDPANVKEELRIEFGDLRSKEQNSIYSIIEDGPVDAKYSLSDKELKLLQIWDDFYKGIEEKVIGFPVWVDSFKNDLSSDLPAWKVAIIKKNKDLYMRNKAFIDEWLLNNSNLSEFTPTQRKLEWQAGASITSIWEGVIQFRPSGVRVKSPNTFPSLVAMVQVPIIGKLKRRLTVREAARLQSFPDNFTPDTNDYQAYKQFGNAVNVEVMRRCAEKLFTYK